MDAPDVIISVISVTISRINVFLFATEANIVEMLSIAVVAIVIPEVSRPWLSNVDVISSVSSMISGDAEEVGEDNVCIATEVN